MREFKLWLAGSQRAKTELLPYEEYRYVLYAKEFGWTPAQVDEIPLHTEAWLLPILGALAEAEAAAMEKARRDAEAKANVRRR